MTANLLKESHGNSQKEPRLNTVKMLFDQHFLISTSKANDLNVSSENVKKCKYYFFAFFGGFRTFLEYLAFFKTICNFIPGLSGPFSYIIITICALINLIFYRSFYVSLYKESLNLVEKEKSNNEYIQNINEQIEEIQICKKLLLCYSNNAEVKTAIDQFINSPKKEIEPHQLKPHYSFAKYFIYGFGALSTIVGEYFMIKSILDELLPLLSLPGSAELITSYIVIIISVIWAVGVYMYTEASGVEKFIHPERIAELELKKELESLQQEYESLIRSNQPPLETKSVKTVETNVLILKQGHESVIRNNQNQDEVDYRLYAF